MRLRGKKGRIRGGWSGSYGLRRPGRALFLCMLPLHLCTETKNRLLITVQNFVKTVENFCVSTAFMEFSRGENRKNG